MHTYILESIDESRNILYTLDFISNVKTNERYFRVTFGSIQDYQDFIKFSITVKENNKTIYIGTFDLSIDDYEIYQPIERGNKIDLVMCDIVNNNIVCDFEVLELKEGIYKVNGTFEPLTLDHDDAFNIIKSIFNDARVEYVQINRLCYGYVDENGLYKGLQVNETFPDLVGNVVVVKHAI